ncbi:zinc finger protein 37-like [Cheilinus undulatus]|uniref:zinc finger protein 37-like n=1 Tax=Cheilinus undulatus TaxID=241271 RepID=UPI001BD31B48|nr:zinc finger protein 37-like [Cheilinus undulatus]
MPKRRQCTLSNTCVKRKKLQRARKSAEATGWFFCHGLGETSLRGPVSSGSAQPTGDANVGLNSASYRLNIPSYAPTSDLQRGLIDREVGGPELWNHLLSELNALRQLGRESSGPELLKHLLPQHNTMTETNTNIMTEVPPTDIHKLSVSQEEPHEQQEWSHILNQEQDPHPEIEVMIGERSEPEAEDCNNVKLFTCSKCGKRYKYKSTLTNHLKTHTEERLFGCPECGKRYKYNSTLADHLKTHTGEKLFGCPECGKRYKNRSNLTYHLKTHRGEKLFSCPECGESYPRTSADRIFENSHRQ